MIKHYLKVALRNLMNFKVHSLISAICLAIGITCFSMMNYFIDAITGKVELSDNNKYSIRLSEHLPRQPPISICLRRILII